MNNTRNKRILLSFKIVILLLSFYAIFWFVGFVNGYVAYKLGTTTIMSNAYFDFVFLTVLVGILYYTSKRIRS